MKKQQKRLIEGWYGGGGGGGSRVILNCISARRHEIQKHATAPTLHSPLRKLYSKLLKPGYIRDYTGPIIVVLKGDTRSLDFGLQSILLS